MRTLDAGTYYVRVDAFAAGSIDYRLRLGQEAGSPPPVEGQTRQTAHDLGDLTGLASARTFTDTVNRDANDDAYRRFTLTASRTMRFELSQLAADADLFLESSTGAVLARSIRSGTADDTIVRTLDAGTYYVRVDAHAAGAIGYQLSVSQEAGSLTAEGGTRQTATDLGDLTTLASPRTFTDTVNRDTNDDDYRRFTLTAERTMRFELSHLAADADLFLESSTGTVLAQSVRGGSADDTIVRTLGAGTYYVRVDAFATGSINYQLRLSQEAGSPPPSDGQARHTAPNLGDLTSLASARTFSGEVDRDTNVIDYRRFTLTARRTMRFELSGLTANADLYLESWSGTTLAESDFSGTADDAFVHTLDAGTYYVGVAAVAGGAPIGYQLSLSRQSNPQSPPPAEEVVRPTVHDFGDLTTLASARTFSDTVNRDTNRDDFLRFTLSDQRTMRFELYNLTADADLYLENSAGTLISTSRRGGTDDDTIVEALDAGTYYVRVRAFVPGSIDYALRVSRSPDGRTRETAHDIGDLTSLASARTFTDTVNRDSNRNEHVRFTLTDRRTMRFELSNLSANADLYLESSTGAELARSRSVGTVDDAIEHTLDAGTYYVRVNAVSDFADYRLRVSQIRTRDGRTRQTAIDLGDLTTLASARTFTDTVHRDTNDDDYRRFTLSASRTMRFELSGLSADADLYLESSTGTLLAQSVQDGSADDTIVYALDAGTYYVRVDAYGAGAIDYRLRLSQQSEPPPSPPAGGQTRQAAHNLGDLTTLASARTFSDTVHRGTNDNDYRRFTLTARRTMRFELSKLTANADLFLESSTGSSIGDSDFSGTADDTLVHTLDAGTYYVGVTAVARGAPIGYRLRLSQQNPPSPPPTEEEVVRSTAHDFGDLTSVASARTFTDTVHRDTNRDDFLRFTLTARRTMRFELSGLSADADLYLESSTGTLIRSSRRGGTDADTIERILDAGAYYVRVRAFASGTIDYQLRVNPLPDGRTRQRAYDLGDLTGLASPRTFTDTVNRDTNDDDYRRFTLTARRVMRFELRGLSADADLYLESSTGTELARSRASGTADDTIVRTLDAGTYYVRVDAYGAGTIDYQLRVEEYEGRSRQTAYDLGDLTSLTSARTFTDTVNVSTNDDDYRRFTLTARRTMRFELSGLSADADLYLESSTGTELARSRESGTADDTIERTLDAGTYYVRVDAHGFGTIDYQLRVEEYGGRTRQTAYDLGDLTSLASGRTFTDTVHRDTNDNDYRRFTLTARRTMRFELSGLSADADLFLENSTGAELRASRLAGTSDDTIVETLDAGTYYVRIDAFAPGTIDYQLSVSREAGSSQPGSVSESFAAPSQRLWRDRDMPVGRSLRTNDEGRLREASGILAA